MKYIIYFTAFMAGFSFMGFEIIGSRIVSPYFGGSVYAWGAMISVFMTGLSFGYFFGGKIAGMKHNLYCLFFVFLASFINIFAVSFIYKYICYFILNINIEIRISVLAASLILFFIPSVLWGISQPCLVAAFFKEQSEIGSSVGRVYAISTAGSIAGVLVVSFYLIGILSTSSAVRLISLPLLISALLFLIYKGKKPVY